MITAVCTSDNHLGAYYARFKPDRMELRRQALQRNFARVVDAAISRRARIFLHAGDLFDRPDPRNADRIFVARQVRRLLDAGIQVFAIAGNHDRPRSPGYDGTPMPQEEMQALDAIHLFPQTDALQSHRTKLDGIQVCVWGMSSDFNRPDGSCPLDGYAHQRGGDVDLVLLHYGVEGWAPIQAREPCLSRLNLERLGADAICVGHLHVPNHRRLESGGLLINPGATEHISFGEESLDCGYWVFQLSPGQAEAEYVTLPTQPMGTVYLDAGQEPVDGQGLTEQLLSQVMAAAHPEKLLRIRLRGKLPRARFHELDLPALQAGASASSFHCQLETDDLSLVDDLSELPLGYGVSFDVQQELQNTVETMLHQVRDDPASLEIYRLAGERLQARYEELTGRAR